MATKPPRQRQRWRRSRERIGRSNGLSELADVVAAVAAAAIVAAAGVPLPPPAAGAAANAHVAVIVVSVAQSCVLWARRTLFNSCDVRKKERMSERIKRSDESPQVVSPRLPYNS